MTIISISYFNWY